MTYALDTNTLIYFFKGLGRVAETLLDTPPSEIAVPAIVVYELETGIRKSSHPEKRRRQLSALLEAVRVLPFDLTCSRATAALRTDLEARGTPIGPMDALIAGTVIAHDAVLVTHNTDEFRRVSGLRIIDWYQGGIPNALNV
ncbi:MAG: type II toxin-antitoxin system VapC family toxin [Spirochaetaceae bacterium]|nr:MAG: type II toxin-antitoxin system VapC family toxin [Spirochaetaceae bacterium]